MQQLVKKTFLLLIFLLVIIIPVFGATNTSIICTGSGNSTVCSIEDQNSIDIGLIIFIASIWLVVFIIGFWLPFMFIVDVVLSIFLAVYSSHYWTGLTMFISVLPIIITVLSGVLVYAFNSNSKR